jgi:hypothetical protein
MVDVNKKTAGGRQLATGKRLRDIGFENRKYNYGYN